MDASCLILAGLASCPGLGPARGTARGGTLRVTTDNLLPGYIRKNGVPHSDHAVLNEYFNLVTGQQGDSYFVVTAMVDDPMYLNGPFIRTYNFKKQAGRFRLGAHALARGNYDDQSRIATSRFLLRSRLLRRDGARRRRPPPLSRNVLRSTPA